MQMYACVCHKGRIESLAIRLSTYDCMYACVSVFICMCVLHAHTYNNGGLKVG